MEGDNIDVGDAVAPSDGDLLHTLFASGNDDDVADEEDRMKETLDRETGWKDAAAKEQLILDTAAHSNLIPSSDAVLKLIEAGADELTATEEVILNDESQMGNCAGDLVQHAADDAAARVELEDTGRRLTLS